MLALIVPSTAWQSVFPGKVKGQSYQVYTVQGGCHAARHLHTCILRVNVCSQHMSCLNRTELQLRTRVLQWQCSQHTNWALTVLVSLQPIKSWRWCAWPMNASCNWVGLLQVSSVHFSAVHVLWTAFTVHDAGDVIRLYCLTLLINIHQRLCLMPLLGKFSGWSRVILWISYCNTARSVDGDFLPW